ncbi:MAG: glycosyltransferase family 4 protein [Promethearchaeota archaeon]
MRILLITDDFYPNSGGIAYTLKTLCENIKRTDHKLYIINPYYEGKNIFKKYVLKNKKLMKDFFNFKDKKFIRVLIFSTILLIRNKTLKLKHRINLILYLLMRPSLFFAVFKNIEIILPLIEKLKIDLLLTGHSGDPLYIALIIGKLKNLKVITLLHGLELVIRNIFSLRTYYIQNADKIIISNPWIKKLAIKIHNIEESKIEIIHRGVVVKQLEIRKTKEELRLKYNIPKSQFVLLSVGRHVERKNFNLVILALKAIKEKIPDINIKYYLIGDGPDTNKLKNLAERLNLNDNITFLGRVDIKTRNEFYKLSDLFVMPSLSQKNSIEGFGIVFIEANFYKVPVIGTRSGGIKEAIVDGKTGFLINPNDLNQLIERILYLYKNPEECINLGLNGYNRVIKEYNWDTIINDYINIFESNVNI